MKVKFSDKVGTVVVIWHERFLSVLFLSLLLWANMGKGDCLLMLPLSIKSDQTKLHSHNEALVFVSVNK